MLRKPGIGGPASLIQASGMFSGRDLLPSKSKIKRRSKKKVSFINKPEIEEIPAEGEGWRHIPSPSLRINRFKTAQECPQGDPEDVAISQSVASNLHIAVTNQLNGYVPNCKYKCKNDSGVCKHCCVDLQSNNQQPQAPACPASTPLEVIADTGSEKI